MKKVVNWFKNIYQKIKNFFVKVDGGIDNGVNKVTNKFSNFWTKYNFVFFLGIFTVLALVLKYCLVKTPSGDYVTFLQPWTYYMGENGGFVKGLVNLYSLENTTSVFFEGIGFNKNVYLCDYPPLYMYFLSFFSILPMGEAITTSSYSSYHFYENLIYYIKTLSFVFEIIFAIYAFKIVKKVTNSKTASCTAYALILILPTVVINGSMWGQCDACYASMVCASVYYLMDKKQIRSMIFFGLALAFKLQVVFILPLFGFAWFRKSFKLRYFLVAFATTFLTFLPLWCAGASFTLPFMPYVRQLTGYSSSINLNSTSMYAIFMWNSITNGSDIKALSTFGMVFTVICSFVLISTLAMKRVKVTYKSLFTIATFSVLMVPFVMPHMHDRYFYLAETFLVMYACTKLNRIHLPIMQQVSGLLAYSCYGIIQPNWFLNDRNGQQIALCTGALLNMGSLGFLIYDLAHLETEPKPERIEEIAENETSSVEENTDENNLKGED